MMMKELRDDILTEKIMKVWYEIGGTTRNEHARRQNRNENEDATMRLMVEMAMRIGEPKTYEMMMKKREEGEKEIGIVIDGD
jgi:FAD/FMN-containing dehydrogenase